MRHETMKLRTNWLRLLTVWLLLAVFGLATAANGLSARLDRNRIAEGETVTLLLATSGEGGGAPDLAPLAQDFDVLNRGQSVHMSYVNGRSSSRREWQVLLAPKRSGTLVVPAIQVGGLSSQPLTLEVLPAAQAAKQGVPPPVRLEVEAVPQRPYVQQKTLYTVRVLSRLPLRQVALSDPQLRDALVEPLGPERRYEVRRDGQQYQVTERRYALFPQHSGALTIEPPVLSAQLPQPAQGGGNRFFGRDPFAGLGGMLEQTRPIQLRGERLTIDVQPQPPGTPSPWLPADSLTLSDSWSPNPPSFRVGEPVSRTLVITAQGVSVAQLPELVPAVPDGIGVYPDKAESATRRDGDTLVAQKWTSAALVPARAGTLTLPGVELAWWDTAAEQLRVARLAAREIEVLPAAAGARPAAPPASVVTAQPSMGPTSGRAVPSAAAPVAATGGEAAGAGYWPWLAVGLGLAWLGTLGLWWRARRSAAAPAAAPPPAAAGAGPLPGVRSGHAPIEAACRADDPRAVRRALLAWAARRWPQDPPQGLEQLAARLGPGAAEVLGEIDRGLYAAAEVPWNGTAAWQALAPLLERGRRTRRTAQPDTALPPLYPHGA
jgi:hypothetical protein